MREGTEALLALAARQKEDGVGNGCRGMGPEMKSGRDLRPR
jgi:hypothetical protein